jgi:hypothetical protein
MPDCLAPCQYRYRNKETQSGTGILRYRTETSDAGMPMPVASTSMSKLFRYTCVGCFFAKQIYLKSIGFNYDVSPNKKSRMFRPLNNAPLGRCAPWTMRPWMTDDTFLGRRVPWTMRPGPMCPDPWIASSYLTGIDTTTLLYCTVLHCYPFVSINAKFCICTDMGLKGKLVEAKMRLWDT